MAIEDVQKFLVALDSDESLAVQADDAYVEALHKVASGAGYGFSVDDLRSGLDAAAGDLADDELDQVVGGFGLSRSLTVSASPVANTVFAGTTSAIANTVTALRFSSFSKYGFSR